MEIQAITTLLFAKNLKFCAALKFFLTQHHMGLAMPKEYYSFRPILAISHVFTILWPSENLT